MAGRGMGAATKGGGAVSKGPRNKKLSSPSKKITVMMKKGGEAVKKRRGGKMEAGGKGRKPAAVARRRAKKDESVDRIDPKNKLGLWTAKKGGDAKKRKKRKSSLIPQHKRLAMGEKVKGYQAGGEIAPDMSKVDRQLAALGPEMEALQETDPRLEAAKRSYEWSQTPEGQAFLAQMEGYHAAGEARNPSPPSAPLQGRAALRRGPDAYNYGNLPPRGYQYGGAIGRQAAAMGPARPRPLRRKKGGVAKKKGGSVCG